MKARRKSSQGIQELNIAVTKSQKEKAMDQAYRFLDELEEWETKKFLTQEDINTVTGYMMMDILRLQQSIGVKNITITNASTRIETIRAILDYTKENIEKIGAFAFTKVDKFLQGILGSEIRILGGMYPRPKIVDDTFLWVMVHKNCPQGQEILTDSKLLTKFHALAYSTKWGEVWQKSVQKWEVPATRTAFMANHQTYLKLTLA